MSNKKKDLTKKKVTAKNYSRNSNLNEQQLNNIPSYGKKIIFVSIIFLIIGFILLKFTNQDGSNWASIISPFVIILSYIGIAIGIIYS